jgi:hypothetical protein
VICKISFALPRQKIKILLARFAGNVVFHCLLVSPAVLGVIVSPLLHGTAALKQGNDVISIGTRFKTVK